MKKFLTKENFSEEFYNFKGQSIKILVPYIKYKVLKDISDNFKTVNIVTKFCYRDLVSGASDLSAVKFALKKGGNINIRFLFDDQEKLHSKIYIFDCKEIICGSSNLTTNGFKTNIESNILLDRSHYDKINDFFAKQWEKAELIDDSKLSKIEQKLIELKSEFGKIQDKINKEIFTYKSVKKEKIENKNHFEYYHINFGHNEHRNWNDCIDFKMIGAGNGSIYSNSLKKLEIGDKIIVTYLDEERDNKGFCGVGEITQTAVPIDKFLSDNKIKKSRLQATNMLHDFKNHDYCEWVVGVDWKVYKRTINDFVFIKDERYYSRHIVTKMYTINPRVKKAIKMLKEKSFI